VERFQRGYVVDPPDPILLTLNVLVIIVILTITTRRLSWPRIDLSPR